MSTYIAKFKDGTKREFIASDYFKARSKARLANHSGIESLGLKTNARRDRARAIAAYRTLKKNPDFTPAQRADLAADMRRQIKKYPSRTQDGKRAREALAMLEAKFPELKRNPDNITATASGAGATATITASPTSTKTSTKADTRGNKTSTSTARDTKKNPSCYVISARRGRGPVLNFTGDKFSNARPAKVFARQGTAATAAKMLARAHKRALHGYTLTVRPVSARANPAPRGVDDAAALLERFSGHVPSHVMRVQEKDFKTGLVIGKLDGVLYSTVRDGAREKYIHEFASNSRPLLAASSDGKQLRIVGGRFQFTEAGIEDR